MARKIRVIKTKRIFWKDSRIGIHLLNPTKQEIQNAIARAWGNGFPTIFVHR